MELSFNKSSFDIEKINAGFKSFCSDNNLSNDELLKLELINEEFLSNILFPNYDGEVKLSIVKNDSCVMLSFEYSGADFMNKITDITIVSLKILQNKTKDIITNRSNGQTIVNFIL